MPPERQPSVPALLGTLAVLYFLQGLPAGLLAKAVPSLAREAGLSREWIGLLALAALPWALKFLWAPWVDRLGWGRPGHRKRWVLACQGLVMVILLVLAVPGRAPWFQAGFPLLVLLLLLLNLASATQDVAADGLAVRLLRPDLRGPGNSLQVLGYKVGLMLSGGLLLIATDWIGWRGSLIGMALLTGLLLIPVAAFAEPAEQRPPPPVPRGRAWWRPFRSFWRRPGLGWWAVILIGYKVGDGFGSRMIKPFLVDQHWSQTAIGQLDLVASLVGMAGAALGGLCLLRMRRRVALIGFGALQALAFVGWWAAVHTPAWIWPVALFEQFADGLSTVALFVVMMDYCRRDREGTDYTLQASLYLVATGLFTLVSGFSASRFGYDGHFLLAAALGGLVIMAALFWTAPGEADTRHD
ncbi:MFS transporter [Alloalcanivorax gelatiniphagus]|uniref:MFS transporter n=1 Tax=Alloalcanivorax gelatiniphagus TaxID=1194167 RepID=UPI001F0DA809|nr:MFS transporter [Alloalcanivorax gelatiniphagus]